REVRRGLCLPTEPLDEGPGGGELGEQNLEGDRAVEQPVSRPVDLGHAAAGDAVGELVAVGEDLGDLDGLHGRSEPRRGHRGPTGELCSQRAVRSGVHHCPAGGLSAASSMAFMIGPATSAPVSEVGWRGTSTATATLGSLAGANPIIQSLVLFAPLPVWAVPVFTATSSERGKTPAAVPEM